jgi:hypothetical protein
MTPTHVPPAPIGRSPGKPWPVADLADHLCSSERHLWRLIAAGRVRVIRLGRKVLVPDDEARRLAADGC